MNLRLAAILLVAFLLRYWRLMTDLPVVGDESLYLRWAEIIDNQGSWFVSLLDGKPPLSYWLYWFARQLFHDPLIGPRLVSVLAGTLSTAGVFYVARRLANDFAGLVAAALYAILPWAMLFDRLAYAESLVNCLGVWTAYAALRAFADESGHWRHALLTGLLLGFGFFTKTTALLWAPALLLAAWMPGLTHLRKRLPRLAAAYGLAALFLGLNAWLTPEAPQVATSSAILHKTHFFIPPSDLLRAPWLGLQTNAPALGDFLWWYLTPLGLVAVLAASVYLSLQRTRGAVFLLGLSLVPILAQAALLDRTFSRYPYPHLWPLLVLLVLAFEQVLDRSKIVAWTALALVGLSFGWGSLLAVSNPREGLAPRDASYFYGDGPNAGWGVAQAVGHIRQAAGQGSVLVLTDPTWGTPADALFAYLNGRDGIRVVEAWWLDAGESNPLIPGREVEVWRSHYERTPGGKIDFLAYDAVFYVTITNYRTRQDVSARQPSARLELSVPKPHRTQSLDVYRLR